MGDEKSDLASQCMAFCQALASKGQILSFTLKVGSAFSLDTRGNGTSSLTKKRKSPSTRRRNARRRAEFLAKKRGPPENESSAEKNQHLKRWLALWRQKSSSVTNVTKTSNLKTAWRYTSEKHTIEWTLILQHLKLRETSWEAQRASLPPPSWTPQGRSLLSSRKLWLGIRVPPLCQSTNAPLTCAVGFDAQKKPKNRRGIGNKCRSSSTGRATTPRPTGGPRTPHSVNKVQTCMTSYELF